MKHAGGCHCGKIAFEVEGDINQAMECNCSLCRKRGTLLWFGPREALKLATVEGDLSTYTFNTHKIQHHFCDNCGVAVYGESAHPKTGEQMVAVNVRCLPDVDLAALRIGHFDGAKLL